MGGRHILTFLGIAGLIILASVLTANSQGDIAFVKDSGFDKHLRPPVPFEHDAHNEKAEIFECNGCHHLYENGEKLEFDASIGMECSQCHQGPNNDSRMALIRAYHLQCRGCHLQEKAGPILCGECHRKATP